MGPLIELGTINYEDPQLFFSFKLPGNWSQGSSLTPFGCTFHCEYGNMDFRVGEVEDDLINIESRKQGLFSYLSSQGFNNITIIKEGQVFAKEENVIFFEYQRLDRKNGMAISIVHNTIQYNIELDGIPQYIVIKTLNSLLSSFKFAPNDRSRLLKEFNKKLIEKTESEFLKK